MSLRSSQKKLQPSSTKDTESLPAHEIFDFFSLPRELRDRIYDSLLTDTKDCSKKYAKITICAWLPKQFLSISRQFKDELQERSDDLTTLVAEDRWMGSPYELSFGQNEQLAQNLHTIKHLRLRLMLQCGEESHTRPRATCAIGKEIDQHVFGWISGLIESMIQLRSLELELYLNPIRHVRECEEVLLEEQNSFTRLRYLTSCDVYHSRVADRNSYDYLKDRTMVMGLSKETGKLARVEREAES